MIEFEDYLTTIENQLNQERTREVLNWIIKKYPNLKTKIAWNQPMFTDHGTFIIGFSVSKNHLAVTPEMHGITQFSDEIIKSGYEHTKMLFRIKWDSAVDYELLKKMIDFNK